MTNKLTEELNQHYNNIGEVSESTFLEVDNKYLEKLQVLLKYPEMLDVVDILINAAKSGKYEDENWLKSAGKGMSKKDNFASITRHNAMYFAGEIVALDSMQDHRLHAGIRNLMSYVRYKRNIKHPDDYNPRGQEANGEGCVSMDESHKRNMNRAYTRLGEDE